ncbi:MAG: IS630 transposase-related protein [Thermomicrobiales bacterium]
MQAYAMDLRERVLAALDAGMSYDQTSTIFQVSRATVGRWRKRQRATGSCAPQTSPGRPAHVARALDAGSIALVTAHPDATLHEHATRWNATNPTSVSPSSVSRALRRANWSRKKEPDRQRTRRGGARGVAGRGRDAQSSPAGVLG